MQRRRMQKGFAMSFLTALRRFLWKPVAASESTRKRLRFWLALGGIGSVLFLPALATKANDPKAAETLRVLIVGGGPDLTNNQVAIESNVRYVHKLLPSDTVRTTLFADGDINHATVLFDDDPKAVPAGERILNLILRGNDSDAENPSHYRKPNLGAKLDGASKKVEVNRAFDQIVQEPAPGSRSLLLYFTGHGSTNRTDLENNVYDLWGRGETLSVRELSRQIARLPESTPVTIVMVQCFSGAFGNLIFEDGDPKGTPIKRDIAGFFATIKERVAAGCTSAINEEYYHDFTSYFFAALTGRDRLGRRVSGADYNGDGKVGMDEAFCYTLCHDESIDIPVCTSDVFLRRYVAAKDTEVFQTPYSSVLSWATPAQRAALEALTTKLHRTGENRLGKAYEEMMAGGDSSGKSTWMADLRTASQRFQSLRREGRSALLRRWPELRRAGTAEYKAAYKEAAVQLAQEVAEGKWKDLLDANEAVEKANMAGEALENASSQIIRFVRLGKSVILAHQLKETGDPEIKARYSRLVQAESRSVLPSADQLTRANP
jgi:hypothetical protein